ncbi:HNH endonuclease, partial [Paeniglutamicibacter sp. MACA_103]
GTLEERVAESVRREDPRTTARLLAGIQGTLEQGTGDVPEEILRARTGLFDRGTTGGLGEFLLRTLPADTEALLALCASTDNPRTRAGDRDGLLAQALATPATATATGSNGSNGSNSQSNNDNGNGAGFPDFLTDPATGRPLTDPEAARNLSLDPNGPGAGSPGPGTMDPAAYGPDGLTPPQRHLQGLMNLIRSAGSPATGKKTTGLPSPKTLV